METFSAGKQIEELTRTLAKLTQELQNQIKQNHDILIFQATWVGLLNSALDVNDTNMHNFKDLTTKTKSKALLRYSTIEEQSKILERVCLTAHKMRLCSQLIKLVKKLKNNRDNVSQIGLQAQIDTLLQDKDIKKFKFLQNEINVVKNEKGVRM
ncbi:uncharacterized protein LOC129614393 [Condylostylus longicornis]|uniref:uncharacterized protein LOC129614393 n=1 Tax=Condylostylus longicornis TaxID=2530218 RepID=UPI00244DBEEF|nr:uncharacterized protein LOC129614393 [Condylostylus longicornis]